MCRPRPSAGHVTHQQAAPLPSGLHPHPKCGLPAAPRLGPAVCADHGSCYRYITICQLSGKSPQPDLPDETVTVQSTVSLGCFGTRSQCQENGTCAAKAHRAELDQPPQRLLLNLLKTIHGWVSKADASESGYSHLLCKNVYYMAQPVNNAAVQI